MRPRGFNELAGLTVIVLLGYDVNSCLLNKRKLGEVIR
jgi:hypothetical protein